MPRLSNRQKAIKSASKLFKRLLLLNIAVGDGDVDEAGGRDTTLEDLLVMAYIRLHVLRNTRYYQRQPYRPSTYAVPRFVDDLHSTVANESEIVPWLTDTEFLRKYRMSRDAFWKLYNLIKDDSIFLPPPGNGKSQRPIAFQLMTCLKAFGEEGSGSSAANLRDVFATGYGTAIVYIQQVVHSMRNLQDQCVSWPDADERKLIAHRIHQSTGLPNCVGMVDGTLFPLSYKPNRMDHADFKGRKHGYSLSGIFVNNDRGFIRYYAAG